MGGHCTQPTPGFLVGGRVVVVKFEGAEMVDAHASGLWKDVSPVTA